MTHSVLQPRPPRQGLAPAPATFCHDSPVVRPNRHLPAASFSAPNDRGVTVPLEVIRMAMQTLATQHRRLPQLFNWLAVLVLLSLGVLV